MEGLSKRERVYFSNAKNEATLSDHRCKIGCVVVDKHRMVSSGHNSNTKCHRRQAELDRKEFGVESRGPVHAEMDALLPFLASHTRELTNASIYVYREMLDGTRGLARPCTRCMKIIKSLGISKVYYSTFDGFAKETITEETV